MKCFSSSLSFSQCLKSCDRSTSSTVQKEARLFLYMSQMSLYSMGRMTNLFGFSTRRGSGTNSCYCCVAPWLYSDTSVYWLYSWLGTCEAFS